MNPRAFQEKGDRKYNDEKWYPNTGHVEQFEAAAYFEIEAWV
jgi:hypothetical protein